MRIFIIVAALFLALGLPGQGIVSPAHWQMAEGNSYLYTPFGVTTAPYHYLQIHDDLQGKTLNLTGMALRRDGNRTTIYKGSMLYCNINLSTALTISTAPDKTFSGNHGPDKKAVSSFYKIDFPATVDGIPPRPFEYKIPFGSPFSYGGKGSLCWEAEITIMQNPNYIYFDAISNTSTNPPLLVRTYGTGCKRSDYNYTAYSGGSSTMNWPKKSGTMYIRGYRGPKNVSGLIFLGYRDDNFGGLPLPFELPGTALAKSGPCNIYVAPIIMLPAFLDANGSFNMSMGVPADPSLFHGMTLFTQWLAMDSKANNWGLITSDKTMYHFYGPWTSASVGYVYNPAAGPTGTVRANAGLIVQFKT